MESSTPSTWLDNRFLQAALYFAQLYAAREFVKITLRSAVGSSVIQTLALAVLVVVVVDSIALIGMVLTANCVAVALLRMNPGNVVPVLDMAGRYSRLVVPHNDCADVVKAGEDCNDFVTSGDDFMVDDPDHNGGGEPLSEGNVLFKKHFHQEKEATDRRTRYQDPTSSKNQPPTRNLPTTKTASTE